MQTPAEFAREHLSEIVPDYLSHKNGGYVPVKGKFFDLVSLCVLAGGSPSAWQMAGKLVADAMLECNVAHGEVPNPAVSFLPQTEDDYVVEFQYPNGSKIRVLIPKKMSDDVLAETPYGLNLVFGGHYE